MHDINHSMGTLQIVWNVDVSVVPLHVHFRWGVALLREFNYWALLTSSWDPPFKYMSRRYSFKTVSTKKARLWP